MITLFGATGYTGQLIAHTLDREGLPYRIAGRSAEKLAALSGELPAHPATIVADAARPSTLPALFAGSQMLINCAGPFTDLGEKVVAQAAMTGTHYLDTTNELGFVFRARTYHEMAQRTGAAIVPACGFEVAFADCLAALLGNAMVDADSPQLLDAVEIFYKLDGMGSSAGTRRSAVRSLATSWIAYRDGEWKGQIPGGKVRKLDLPDGFAYGLLFPSSESVTVPAHVAVRRVDTWMGTSPFARLWAPVGVPLLARLSRSILRGLILNIAARGALEPGVEIQSPFTVNVQARLGSQVRWMQLTGYNPYDLTAKIAAYAAREFTRSDYAKSGNLAPSQAFDPAAFLGFAVREWGLTLREGLLS
jgi:short subunit dehydrogenase-like uncharacterized protein